MQILTSTSLHQNTVLWNIEPIITLYCKCQNVSTVVSQLQHIWVNLQYNEIYLQSILSETQFRFFNVLALGSYIINIWVTANSYANKYGYQAFCQLFGLLCFILYKKKNALWLLQVKNDVTFWNAQCSSVHIAIEIDLIISYIKITSVKNSCTMHRYGLSLDNLRELAHRSPLRHQKHP